MIIYSLIKQNIKLGGVVIILFLTISCAAPKRVNYPTSATDNKPQQNQPKSIEKQLGIPISVNDPNLPLYKEVTKWIGTPYKYGGMTLRGTDCSGFTFQVYKAVYRRTLHRTVADVAKYDVRTIQKDELRPGDFVFFATSKSRNVLSHIGIYLKNNRFIHASTMAGVVVNSLNDDYYKKALRRCGRVK